MKSTYIARYYYREWRRRYVR